MFRAQESITGDLTFTGQIAGWSARHRWLVIAAAAAFIVLAMFVSSTLETDILSDESLAVGESGTAADLVDDRFEFDINPTEQLVISNPNSNVDDPQFISTVQAVTRSIRDLAGIGTVTSFYTNADPDMVSADGTVVLASVEVLDDSDHVISELLEVVQEADQEASEFEIVIAGQSSIEFQAEELIEEDMSRIMMVTLVIGLVILLIAFQAVVAAVIPLIMAIGAIFSATGLATLVSQAYPLDGSYEEMILLMGLAVGIDYSLFIISRFRSERKAGKAKLEAITEASNTTGRAVFYAGVTVVLSLVGLMLTQNPIFISLALGAVLVVLLAIVGSLTLLPAILSVLGDNINRLRIPFPGRGRNGGGGFWGVITDRVLARPGILATVTVLVLIALAVPVVSLNLGFNAGADSLPDELIGKRALQILEEDFSSGRSQPAWVVVDAAYVYSPDVQSSLASLTRLTDSHESFSGPYEIQVNDDADLLLVRIPIAGAIDDKVSEQAIQTLRDEIIPEAFAGSGAEVYVTGFTAASMDFRDSMYDSAPYVFGFVLGLAFLLLMVMFRSIVIPVKAIVLNLLSVGAAYGVVVMVFQWGWGVSLLGSEPTTVIGAWLPLFLFGILFGLSMDYHMLLLNRVKEAYDQGYSNEESVSIGVKITAGQITSAAAIMVGVFGAFALSSNVGMQQFGLGLGVAIFIDATIIRVILLPASMKLLGDRNWYLPSWLNWLPRLGAGEGSRGEARPVAESTSGYQALQLVSVTVPVRTDN